MAIDCAAMLLSQLAPGGADVEIAALAYDSRDVEPGTLFFCVPGERSDGHDHAPDAVARGAAALVVERPLGLGVPELLVPSAREAMAPIAVRFNGDPSARLRVAGVTGTNGKTTSGFLLRALLEAGGEACALLGTVKSVIGGEERPVARTTPEAIDLQASFREMVDSGDRACAMEVSSHALALHRVDGTRFAAALFTNLTQDHLDFHGTMEGYFAAKRALFDQAERAVVNVEDEWGKRLAQELPHARTFTPDDDLGEVDLHLRGRFNRANALGAIAAARELDVPEAAIRTGIERVRGVPGRFESVDEGQPFAVIVDYAHTPDSLENVLRTARTLGEGRLVVVFGAGGDRDREKRPLMGKIAAGLADRAIVTTDNPRTEEPGEIAAEVAAGAPGSLEVIVNRADAIDVAIGGARAGDVVVIAGKGADTEMELAGYSIPFDDKEVAREALRRAPAASRRSPRPVR